MVTLEEAVEIVEKELPSWLKLYGEYGEAQGKYVFYARRRSDNSIVPGGFYWTVDKETGTPGFSDLKRVSLRPPWAPIVGYKKLGRFPDPPKPN